MIASYRIRSYMNHYHANSRQMIPYMTHNYNSANLQHLLMALRDMLTQRHLLHNANDRLLLARAMGCLIEIPRERFTALQIQHVMYIYILYFGRHYKIIVSNTNTNNNPLLTESNFCLDPESPLAPLLVPGRTLSPLMGRHSRGWVPINKPSLRQLRFIERIEQIRQGVVEYNSRISTRVLNFCLIGFLVYGLDLHNIILKSMEFIVIFGTEMSLILL